MTPPANAAAPLDTSQPENAPTPQRRTCRGPFPERPSPEIFPQNQVAGLLGAELQKYHSERKLILHCCRKIGHTLASNHHSRPPQLKVPDANLRPGLLAASVGPREFPAPVLFDVPEDSFGGHAPPAALYYASRDRKHEHPVQHLQAFTGILQADAYSGYNELYDPSRSQGAITAALCWAHARRQFFELVVFA